MNLFIMTKLILSTKRISVKERFLKSLKKIKPTTSSQVQAWNFIRKELVK